MKKIKVVSVVVVSILIVLCTAFFVFREIGILSVAIMGSESMENTISEDKLFLYSKKMYGDKSFDRFDVVLFEIPDIEDESSVSRIVGLPGETVEVRDGKIYIDGAEEPLDDSYCPEDPDGRGDGVWEVPEDSYFVMGDNRNYCIDSRYWISPFVSKEKIIGKVLGK